MTGLCIYKTGVGLRITWGLDGAMGLTGNSTAAHRGGSVPGQFESAVS
jgi:hypothetical protein